MNQIVECPIDRNMPPPPVRWHRIFQSTLWFILFSVLATIALLWALGYRVNWTTRTVEQTSIVEVSMAQAGLNPEVYIDGIYQPSGMPLTLRWLFPGRYDIEVRKTGYHSWEKQVEVGPNERANLSTVLLLYEEPVVITPPNVRIDSIVGREYDNNGIEVRNGNELWVRGKFMTRTSADIINPEYYFDNEHVIYQTGDMFVVRDLETSTSQRILTLSGTEPVAYTTQDNGRVFIFVEPAADPALPGTLKAVELFQQTSVIDRFTH